MYQIVCRLANHPSNYTDYLEKASKLDVLPLQTLFLLTSINNQQNLIETIILHGLGNIEQIEAAKTCLKIYIYGASSAREEVTSFFFHRFPQIFVL